MRSEPILLADDDENDVLLMQLALSQAHISNPLIVAKNGKEAVELLARRSREGESLPALMVLDIKMPGMDGFDVLAWLEAHPQFHKIPVAILSSSKTTAEAAAAQELGASGYYVKCASLSKLAQIVEELVRRFLA